PGSSASCACETRPWAPPGGRCRSAPSRCPADSRPGLSEGKCPMTKWLLSTTISNRTIRPKPCGPRPSPSSIPPVLPCDAERDAEDGRALCLQGFGAALTGRPFPRDRVRRAGLRLAAGTGLAIRGDRRQRSDDGRRLAVTYTETPCRAARVLAWPLAL